MNRTPKIAPTPEWLNLALDRTELDLGVTQSGVGPLRRAIVDCLHVVGVGVVASRDQVELRRVFRHQLSTDSSQNMLAIVLGQIARGDEADATLRAACLGALTGLCVLFDRRMPVEPEVLRSFRGVSISYVRAGRQEELPPGDARAQLSRAIATVETTPEERRVIERVLQETLEEADAEVARQLRSAFLSAEDRTGSKDEREAGNMHSPDFCSARWNGQLYTFTKGQAACVRVLWEAWEQETPVLSGMHIGEAAGAATDDFRLSARFKSNGEYHPAWNTMIVSPKKGYYRLAL